MRGLAVSPGVAVARTYLVDEPDISVSSDKIPEDRVNEEIDFFRLAVEKTRQQLRSIYEDAVGSSREESAAIIQAHMEFIDEPVLIDEIVEKVEKEHFNINYAVNSTICEWAEKLEKIEDAYIRERAADLRDVGRRICRCLQKR